jgi:hypothetical protein
MTAAKKIQTPDRDQVSTELMEFLAQFSGLLNQHITTVRGALLETVDQAMSGVMALNAAADHKIKKADEVLVKDDAKFVSKSARDVDGTFSDPSAKIKNINETLSSHMAGLGNLDESVRGFLFAIMGGLSIDDVVRQRLEHVSTGLVALQKGVGEIITKYNAGEKITDTMISQIQHEMMEKMYKCFTMEDEKKIFDDVFGKVKGINQKS